MLNLYNTLLQQVQIVIFTKGTSFKVIWITVLAEKLKFIIICVIVYLFSYSIFELSD